MTHSEPDEGPLGAQPWALSKKPGTLGDRITARSRRPRPASVSVDLESPEGQLGDRVRRLRIEHGWSQAELAARVASQLPNWAQTTVAKTEAASRPIRVNEAAALAAALGVPLHALLVDDEAPDALRARAELQGLLLEDATLRARLREVHRQAMRLEHEEGEIRDRLHDLDAEVAAAVAALKDSEER
jgi:transcriptional regulator with XRE-family HTH domain